MLLLVAVTFAYCMAGVRLAQWWVGSEILYDPYETALGEVPFWTGTTAIVVLVLFSAVMGLLGRWKHEWFIVLCAGAVAWVAIVFTLIIVSALISF